jgi:hypothetical protein
MSLLKTIHVTDQDSGATASVSEDGELKVDAATLQALVMTLQELIQRLAPLAGMANSGQPALRVIPIASVSTAVSGSLTNVTTVGTLTNFGTGVRASETANSINSISAALANINNVTISA